MKKRFFSRFFMSAHQQRLCFLPGSTAFVDGLVDNPCEDHLFRIIVGCAELFRPVRNLPVLLRKETDALGFLLAIVLILLDFLLSSSDGYYVFIQQGLATRFPA